MTEPTRSLRTAILMAAAAAVGALVASGVFLIVDRLDTTPPPFNISGKAVIDGHYGGGCPSLATRAVRVLDKSGVVIAVGQAEIGRNLSDSCLHLFSVADVEAGHAAYGIVVVGLEHPPVFFTEEVLRGENPVELMGSYPRNS